MTDTGLYRFGTDYEGLPQEQPFISDATGDSLANDLILVDTPQDLLLTVTRAQYTNLLSAALNGANRHFGANYIDVIYPLIKAGKNLAGDEVSCIDVANCIETDESVLAALMSQLAQQGFQQSPESTDASNITEIPSSMSDANMLPSGYDCATSDNNMAIARAIVRELHETVIDLLESIEYATNAAEAANIASDGVPIIGTLNNVLELADWLLESLTELYQASYTQAVEDELACDIFCHLETDCSLSLNELIDIYEAAGGELPSDMSSLQAAITGLVDIPLSAGIVSVAVAHCWVLWMLRFGGDFAGIKGWKSIENVVKSSASYIDVSWDDCDCATPEDPTLYWMLYYDFRLGSQYDTAVAIVNGNNNDGFWNGDGYLNVSNNSTNVNYGIVDLGAQYVIKAYGMHQVRRGSAGNGTHDFASVHLFPNINYGGTVFTIGNNNFINVDGNNLEFGIINGGAVNAARSIRQLNRVYVPANSNTRVLRAYEWVIWGLAGAGDTKPSRAKWAGNSLPATVAELFP